MRTSRHKQYEWTDEASQPTRQPSHLYHLAPVGAGTARVEGLTSYIARLADAHHAYPGELLVAEIVPRITSRNYLHWTASKTVRYPTGLSADTIWLNGASQLTHELVPILEALTLRSDLRYTTMLTWEEAISTVQLLKPYRAWCSHCLAAWQSEGKMLYEPLVWQLAPSRLCQQHNAPLDSICPHCQRTSRPLTARMQAGYCGHCLGWLGHGEPQGGEAVSLDEAELASQIWVESCLGELLTAMPNLEPPPTKEGLHEAIGSYATQLTRGNRWLLGRRLGITRNSFAAWYDGSHLPSLASLINLSRRLNTTPLRLLTEGENAATNVQLQFHFVGNAFAAKKLSQSKQFDAQEASRVLQRELASTSEPLGIEAIARKYGYNVPTLYKRLPDLCRALTAKHAEFVAEQRRHRQAELHAHVREAVFTMHQQGLNPSQTKVAKLVRSSGGVRWLPEFKDAYQAATAELAAGLAKEA